LQKLAQNCWFFFNVMWSYYDTPFYDVLYSVKYISLRVWYISMHLINMHNIPATYNIYKDYAFRGFSLCPDPFLKCQRFMNLVIYFIRAMSSLILSYDPSGRSFFFITLLIGVVKRKKTIMDGDRGERWGKIDRSLIIGRMVSHILFIL